MSSSQMSNLTKQLFTGRLNCLLVNVSSKHICDSRLDFDVIATILPAFKAWCSNSPQGEIQNHTVYTFCCTNQISKDVVYVGEIETECLNFKHIFFLVRADMLSGRNISLLRTTMERCKPDELNELQQRYFDNTVFLDFYNWHTEAFRHYYQQITHPFAVAVMDGFNKIASTEKETRQNEITKICDQYRTTEGVRNQYVDKRFDYANFAYLSSYVDSPRSELEGQIKKQIEFIATCFGRDGVNIWREIFNYTGINRIAANPALYSAQNILDKCVLPCLRDEVLKDDFELFCEIVPNWSSEVKQLLSNHPWKTYNQEQFEVKCDSLVGKSFSYFVIKQLNKILA